MMRVKGNLIFFLNRRCTVGCASCNAGVFDENAGELKPRFIERLFDKIDNLEFSGYIIWTGGEPFLSFETLEKGITLATQKGFNSEILTAGIWFENNPGYLETLAATGSFSLRISLDAEHQERVPMALVISLIKRALELNIEVNFTLREIPGGNKNNSSVSSVSSVCSVGPNFLSEIENRLPDFYRENRDRSRWIHSIPHMPVAPGGSRPRLRGRKWQKACQMGFKDLVIGEDGLVYPCCGLFGIPGHEQLAVTLFSETRPTPLLRVLKEKGPYGICKELNFNPETWNWPSYDSPCHLCLALFHLHGSRVFKHYIK